jgi:hypothetical protein
LEYNGQFSPDGRWIAYQSDESRASSEIYVAPFPGPGGRRQISIAGGNLARWRGDGKEIFFVAPDGRLMAAEVNIKGDTLESGAVRPLFGPLLNGGSFANGYQYDVSADGQRVLVVTTPNQSTGQPLTLVQNWTTGLKK